MIVTANGLYKAGKYRKLTVTIMNETINEKHVRVLVSKNLKRLRSLQNISQLGLAMNAGLTHNFINDIENCKKGISAKTLAKLSVALQAEPHQFFLPEDMSNNKMLIYVTAFNDSLQKLIKELTEQFLPPSTP
jgi:transcriptional regulator with XRE-family HTH domain